MRKIIIAGVGVIVLGGLAAAPYVSGMLIEQRLQGMKVVPGMGGGTVWSLDAYERGYLHSTAKSSVRFDFGKGAPLVLHFRQDIDQIPGLDGRYATVRTVWVPDADQKAAVQEIYGDKDPVSFTTILRMNGSSHTDGDFTPVNKDGVTFSGGKFVQDTTADGRFTSGLTIDSFSATQPKTGNSPPETVTVSGIDLKADGRMSEKHIVWDSNIALNVASMKAGDQGNVSGLSVTGQSARTGDDARFEVTVGAQKFDFPEAPAWAKPITDMRVNYGLSRISAPVVEKVVAQIQKAKARGDLDSKQLSDDVRETLMSEMPALLDKGPIFTMNPIRFTVPSGPVDFHLSVELPPGHGADGAKNPMLLISLLKVNGDFSAPESLMMDMMAEQGKAENGRKNLDALVQQGYVTQANGMLSTKFAFTDGKLTVNGQPADQMAGMLGALSGGM
ncbi:hypothetical protein A9404_11080 [Halothiobacillus diazotrophicus]|uniref:DUF945 domain-containing protein n=1 Tax=Halothiobacillus diazotrophicus TaxID=1860122 RepID=A0A191ZIY6_9GAMM|nr:YdgA family protein [Halothiobacillus diazotrophicus]ANJ67849.1 hypothetical protein A9404_11080 [Halothiobacillus diazotrophicus]